MTVKDLPTINALLNTFSALFLVIGFVRIKRGDQLGHKKAMVTALISSAVFLTCYLIYHYHVGSVKYPHHDWTRPLYFAILIPHVILAAVQTPFILFAVWHAFKDNLEKHRKIVRWLWPVWMFVSVSGVAVYFMLYVL